MGCWGYGIMESDGALDLELEFQDIAGISSSDSPNGENRKHLEKNLELLFERARAEPVFEDQTQFRAEAFQVLAVMLMREGCQLTQQQREELLTGLQSCYEYQLAKKLHEKAATENRRISEADLTVAGFEPDYNGYDGILERLYGRMQAIDEQAALLQSYDINGGTPLDTPSVGLLETFFKKKSAVA